MEPDAQLLKELVRRIVEAVHPLRIILFGSAAWGENDEVNDLDFFIIKKNVPYYGGDRINELYRLIDAHSAVDYIVYKPEEAEKWLALGDPFLKKIFTEGKVLYG